MKKRLSYNCDEKLKIYKPFSYARNLEIAQHVYHPEIIIKKKAKRKPLVTSTTPKYNYDSLMRKYMTDYKKMTKLHRMPLLDKDISIDVNEYQNYKNSWNINHLTTDIEFVDIDINRELKYYEDENEKSKIKKQKIAKDYEKRLNPEGYIEEVNESSVSHSKKEKSTDKEKSIAKESEVEKTRSHKSNDMIIENPSNNFNQVLEDSFKEDNNNTNNKSLNEREKFLTRNDTEAYNEIAHRVIQDDQPLIPQPQNTISQVIIRENSIKTIQSFFRIHREKSKKRYADYIYATWDKSHKNIMKLFFNKTLSSFRYEDQVLSLYVRIYFLDKMTTFSDIISVTEMHNLDIISDPKINKKDIKNQKIKIAEGLFKVFEKKIQEDLKSTARRYSEISKQNETKFNGTNQFQNNRINQNNQKEESVKDVLNEGYISEHDGKDKDNSLLNSKIKSKSSHDDKKIAKKDNDDLIKEYDSIFEKIVNNPSVKDNDSLIKIKVKTQNYDNANDNEDNDRYEPNDINDNSSISRPNIRVQADRDENNDSGYQIEQNSHENEYHF